MLVKLTPFLHNYYFRVILGSISTTFYAQLFLQRSKKCKRDWQLDWIFMLLGFLRVKAVSKHVGKIDPSSLKSVLWLQSRLIVRTNNCIRNVWLLCSTHMYCSIENIDSISNFSCVATSVLRMCSLHAVAFSKKLCWLI